MRELRDWENERERERVRGTVTYSQRGIFGTSSKIGIGLKQLIILALFGYLEVYLA